MNNVSGYSPCPIILSVKSQMLFYAVGGSFAPANTEVVSSLDDYQNSLCSGCSDYHRLVVLSVLDNQVRSYYLS